MERNIYGYFEESRFVDLRGRAVKRNPWTNPYDFDEYVEWKGNWDENDSAVYSDRLRSWDTSRYEKCRKEVWGDIHSKAFDVKHPELVEKFLSLYNDEKIKLTAITRGCNVANGFPYYVYHYRTVKE